MKVDNVQKRGLCMTREQSLSSFNSSVIFTLNIHVFFYMHHKKKKSQQTKCGRGDEQKTSAPCWKWKADLQKNWTQNAKTKSDMEQRASLPTRTSIRDVSSQLLHRYHLKEEIKTHQPNYIEKGARGRENGSVTLQSHVFFRRVFTLFPSTLHDNMTFSWLKAYPPFAHFSAVFCCLCPSLPLSFVGPRRYAVSRPSPSTGWAE